GLGLYAAGVFDRKKADADDTAVARPDAPPAKPNPWRNAGPDIPEDTDTPRPGRQGVGLPLDVVGGGNPQPPRPPERFPPPNGPPGLVRPVPPPDLDPVPEPIPVPRPDPVRPPPMRPDPNVPLVRPQPVGLLRPAARMVPITPTRAADKSEVKLPGSAEVTCYAGGGRFILLRIPSARQVAVFDVSEGKVAKYVPLPEEGALIAGGMSHLYVLAPDKNVIQRWNLETFAREATAPNPVPGQPKQILTGHATDGPLFVVSTGGFQAVDTTTFQSAPVPVKGGRGAPQSFGNRVPQVRVSADGRVIGWWDPNLGPSGLNSLVLGADEAKGYSQHISAGAVLPGQDGTLFTSTGLYTPDLKPLGNRRPISPWSPGPVPAAQGGFYLEFPATRGPMDRPADGVALKVLGDDRTVADLGMPDGLDLPTRPVNPRAPGLQVCDRVFLVPDAKALVILNNTGDRLTVHRVDAEGLLKKSPVPYLFVSGQPPVAERSTTFSYTPTVKSKAGGVKIAVTIGPDGMKVVGDKIVWAVPRNFAGDEVSVILTVSDASGQEVIHTFILPVTDRPRR
ncbi:MAG TPA: hypothetical protein VKE74_16805, partial [Gemmataceae bacterium]|nr:hypothetical protein [Gemmataceae bacterium]